MSVPLSFASLDLVHRAEKGGGIPRAEIHAPNSPAMHIAVAAPVRNATGVIHGVAHVAISPQAVLDVVLKVSFTQMPPFS